MRRISLLVAAAAIGVSGLASAASADDTTVCVGQRCVCLYGSGSACYKPPAGDGCIAVDLDSDGDAERICLPVSS
ncbi:MAG TPA: hypothetical protein VNA20_11430 [Frankiaceae bacterium]|nr:hypothetical protein [Frankiaceae bacterium]